jgi:predicted RNase H-like nuclease (RuvC/YqgF family)
MTYILKQALRAIAQPVVDWVVLVKELADEIERLQDCNKARDHEIQGLYAEIERLQAELNSLRKAEWAQLAETHAEIERLDSLRSAEITAYNKRIDELEAEIARLKDELQSPSDEG